MIGGTERPVGAMVGGLILGILEEAAKSLINTQASDWFPFVVVVVILLLVPQGLFSIGPQLRSLAGSDGGRERPSREADAVADAPGIRRRPASRGAATLPWRVPAPARGGRRATCTSPTTSPHGTLYLQGLILVAAVFGILAVSLDLVAGMAGLYSLGHAGLFALGAYGTTLLYNDRHWNLFALLPASMVGVGLVGLVLGALSLRVSGLYFAITTFIFTLVVTVVASDFAFTGGYGGLIGPIFPGFPGWLDWLGQSLIWCGMVALLVAILLSLGLRRSPLYPVLLAIRDAEPFAAAAGARTALLKIGLFGLSAAMAGAAGWVFTFQGFISPGQFNWTVSVNILVMVILGGMNTTIGPVLGAAFVSMFPAQVNINPFWQEVLFGGLFVGRDRRLPGRIRRARPAARALAVRLLPGAAREPAPRTPGRGAPADRDRTGRGAAPRAERAAGEAVGARTAATAAPSSRSSAAASSSPTQRGRGRDDVDFLVRKGSIHGLIGPNGSGKTTLVDLIAGRLKPLAGTIELDGRPLEAAGPRRGLGTGSCAPSRRRCSSASCPRCDNVGVGLYSRVPRIVAARARLAGCCRRRAGTRGACADARPTRSASSGRSSGRRCASPTSRTASSS